MSNWESIQYGTSFLNTGYKGDGIVKCMDDNLADRYWIAAYPFDKYPVESEDGMDIIMTNNAFIFSDFGDTYEIDKKEITKDKFKEVIDLFFNNNFDHKILTDNNFKQI